MSRLLRLRLSRLSHGGDAVGPPPRPVCAVGSSWAARSRLRGSSAGCCAGKRRGRGKGSGGGVAGCVPAGGRLYGAQPGNVGRVPLMRYVWINIISLGQHADFANCASAGAAGLAGVLGHQGILRLPTLELRRDQHLSPTSVGRLHAGFFLHLTCRKVQVRYLWLRSKLHFSPGLGLKVASPEG